MEDRNEKVLNYLKSVFPDYEISLSKSYYREDDYICVRLEKDGFKKYFYYNCDEDKIESNPVDASFIFRLPYGNAYTLHSYLVNGGIRVFIGITNIDNGVVLPVGFDVNNKEYIIFPKDENNLIDEEVMIKTIENENPSIRYGKELYKNATKICQIHLILRNLIGHDNIFDKLDSYNEEEISELEEKTNNRLKRKFKNK